MFVAYVFKLYVHCMQMMLPRLFKILIVVKHTSNTVQPQQIISKNL